MDTSTTLWDPDDPYNPNATISDIYHCFRLLLGRYPNPEEWAGHSGLAGNDLRSVVRSYLDSPEFIDRSLLVRRPAEDIALTRTTDFAIYTALDDLAVGKHVAAGLYEPEVAALLRRTLRCGMYVVDIGANIGYFTMLAASLVGPAGSVLAVEPNLANVKMIEASRRANNFSNVTIAACALGKAAGILALHTAFSNGMTSPVGKTLNDVMASQIVPCQPLASLVSSDRRIDFIKIDVEGAEYAAFLASRAVLERWHPIIASEFSPGLLQGNSRVTGIEYLKFFAALGYEARLTSDDDDTPARPPDEIMRAYARSGVDHIDIWLKRATPKKHRWRKASAP